MDTDGNVIVLPLVIKCSAHAWKEHLDNCDGAARQGELDNGISALGARWLASSEWQGPMPPVEINACRDSHFLSLFGVRGTSLPGRHW